MADATFDGGTMLVLLPSEQSEVDVKGQIYGAWKRWAKTGTNARFLPAFESIGGDPTTAAGKVSPFFFLRNDLGWRIRCAEEDIEVTLVGNLYGRDPALPIMVPTLGDFTVLMTLERDASSVVQTLGSGLSSEQDTRLAELHRLGGLQAGTPLTVTSTTRRVGAEITQSIEQIGDTVTVTRT